MSFIDKKTHSVADAVRKIMEASAKKADGDYDQDGKVESPKAEVLGSRIRAAKAAGKMKEETEQIDELSKSTLGSYIKKANASQQNAYEKAGYKSEEPDRRQGLGRTEKIHRAVDKLVSKKTNEETEQIDEAFPTVADGEKSLKAKEGKTTYGKITKTKTGMKHERDYDDQPEPEVKRGRGRPKKRLSEMRQEYLQYAEEVDNETFTKEFKDQKSKFDGKKKGGDVAKAAVQAVKTEEVEQIDEADIYSIKNTKTGQIYHHSKYPITKDTGVYKKIKSAGGEHKHAAIHKNGKPVNEETEQMDEVAPPGREKQVKALKKVPGIDNPWAVSWASYRKSHPKKG